MKYIDETVYVTINPGCGCPSFAVQENVYNHMKKPDPKKQGRQEGPGWYCPKCGACRCYILEETSEQKEIRTLKNQLQQEQTGRIRAEGDRDATRRMYNRMRKRIQNGTCPCCDKTFHELRDHMHTEHSLTDGQLMRTLREHYGLTQQNLADETGIGATYISKFENGHKDVPAWAHDALERWMGEQVA